MFSIPVEVDSNNTTASASDYSAVPASITISGTATTGTFTLTATDDSTDEPTEKVRVRLGSALPSGATAGSPSFVDVSITDGDATAVTLGSVSGRLFEDDTDDSQQFTVTLGRELAPGETAKVRLQFTYQIDDSKTPAGSTFTPSASGVGVTWDNGHTVTFTRPSGGDTDGDGTVDSDDTVRTATVTVTPAEGEDGNTRDDSITYQLDSSYTNTAHSGIDGGITGSGIQTFTIVDAGEIWVFTESIPLTAQAEGWPQLHIPAHPGVHPTTGARNYWLGRDMWMEPGTNGGHWYYIWLTKPAHETITVQVHTITASDGQLSVGENGTKTTTSPETFTITAGEGRCDAANGVYYGGPFGCNIRVYVWRDLPAHQTSCANLESAHAYGSVFGADSSDHTDLNPVRVAMPKTHLNAGDTTRDWTTTKNSRTNAYKNGGVCPTGRITPNKPKHPR